MSIGNPYLDEFSRLEVEARSEARDRFIARYGFAVPTDDALSRIQAVSPDGVVEIGAGTGYWARLLHDRGVDIEAYDVAPPSPAGSPANRWFGVDALVRGARGGRVRRGRRSPVDTAARVADTRPGVAGSSRPALPRGRRGNPGVRGRRPGRTHRRRRLPCRARRDAALQPVHLRRGRCPVHLRRDAVVAACRRASDPDVAGLRRHGAHLRATTPGYPTSHRDPVAEKVRSLN
jgi:hypothetical protein